MVSKKVLSDVYHSEAQYPEYKEVGSLKIGIIRILVLPKVFPHLPGCRMLWRFGFSSKWLTGNLGINLFIILPLKLQYLYTIDLRVRVEYSA